MPGAPVVTHCPDFDHLMLRILLLSFYAALCGPSPAVVAEIQTPPEERLTLLAPLPDGQTQHDLGRLTVSMELATGSTGSLTVSITDAECEPFAITRHIDELDLVMMLDMSKTCGRKRGCATATVDVWHEKPGNSDMELLYSGHFKLCQSAAGATSGSIPDGLVLEDGFVPFTEHASPTDGCIHFRRGLTLAEQLGTICSALGAARLFDDCRAVLASKLGFDKPLNAITGPVVPTANPRFLREVSRSLPDS